MQGLILAAGRGKRLNGHERLPKCLHEVGGKTLLAHQLDALTEAGVDSVVIVAGFEHEQVMEAAGGRATFVLNEAYAETNSLVSFWLAREEIDGSVVVLNADLLIDPLILQAVLARRGSALAFDRRSGLEDEQMKVQHWHDVLVEMRKNLPLAKSDGENVGLVKLGRRAARTAFAAAEARIAAGERKAWLAAAVNVTAREHRIRCVDVSGLPWIEIDFPEDLARARAGVWPAIAAARSSESSTDSIGARSLATAAAV